MCSDKWKCGLHVFHTTAATTEHVQSILSMIGIVGICFHSIAESCRSVLFNGNAISTRDILNHWNDQACEIHANHDGDR